MSVCSFLSDEVMNDSENQSFLEFSLDTSHIPEISITSHSKFIGGNSKKLQMLLFQTNFYLQKLEEQMKDTQRKLEVEICIRKIRSHQTVLGLKLNSDSIDESFMEFVEEKQKKLLQEVKHVLEGELETLGCEVNVTQGCDTTGLSSPQVTPAFSVQKSFNFKEFDCLDSEISQKLNSTFFSFFQHPDESHALDCLTEGTFCKKFPKATESLQKVVKSLGMYKSMSKRESCSSTESRCKEISREKVGLVKECVQKALAVQEFHLNLEGLKKKGGKITNFTQTLDSDEHFIKVQTLEKQLKDLNGRLEELRSENERIRRYQNELLEQVQKKKEGDKENCEFFKERFENSNRILIGVQENYKKLIVENGNLKESLGKVLEWKGGVLSKANGARYELAAGIKDLEKLQKEFGGNVLDRVIAGLHKVSLMMFIKDIESECGKMSMVPKSSSRALQSRSRSSLKTASEKLDLYILNH